MFALGVANVTRGDLEYRESVAAQVDDVIKVQFWLAPHSVEALLSVHIRWTPEGSRIEGGVSLQGDAERATARVSPSIERAYLDPVGESVAWRHSVDGTSANYVTEALADSAFPSEALRLPPSPVEESVTVLVRLLADVVATDTSVRQAGLPPWRNGVTATPGDEVEVLVSPRNAGNTEVQNLSVGCRLPDFLALQPGTTRVATAQTPEGEPYNDNIATGGIDIGHYAPGANAYATFKARIVRGAEPGEHRLRVSCVTQAENTLAARDRATIRLLVPGTGSSEMGSTSWFWLVLAVAGCLISGGFVVVLYDRSVGVALALAFAGFVMFGLLWGTSAALAGVGTVVTVLAFLIVIRGSDRRDRRPLRRRARKS